MNGVTALVARAARVYVKEPVVRPMLSRTPRQENRIGTSAGSIGPAAEHNRRPARSRTGNGGTAVAEATRTGHEGANAVRCAREPLVSVVIPALNEAACLPHVLSRLPGIVGEVVLVDGRSVDDTVAVACAVRPDVRVVVQDGWGKGNALACGFAVARGEIIVMLDADGSNDPGEIVAFVEALLGGADFAKGSRFVAGGGSRDLTRVRRVGNRGLCVLVNVLFGTGYSDLCYGYNAFWRHCLAPMDVCCDGFEVETLINVRIARAGLCVIEVASIEHERLHGESKLHPLRDGLRVLAVIARERLRPRRARAQVPVVAGESAC